MEKITWTELRKAIAERINADEKEVATFLNALVPAITKALREDRQVRIANLGTFKLQSIAPRKSVNVATGEAFTLPGYDKLVFVPETSIKEMLGNPATSAVEDVDTPLKKLGAQADEIVDILGDLGQGPKAVVKEEPKVEEPKVAEPAPEPESEPTPVVEPEPEAEPAPVVEDGPIIMTSETRKKEPKEKQSRTWLVVGITVLIFALVLAGAFLFVGNRFVAWVDSMHSQVTMPVQQDFVEYTATEPIEINEPTEVVETKEVVTTIVPVQPAEPAKPAKPTKAKSTLPYPYEFKEFIATEYLQPGSRLALLARRYYNETDMWVFIYEANKNTIQHPSDIPVGTKIRIPKIPRELRDLSNPETRQLVDELSAKYKAL